MAEGRMDRYQNPRVSHCWSKEKAPLSGQELQQMSLNFPDAKMYVVPRGNIFTGMLQELKLGKIYLDSGAISDISGCQLRWLLQGSAPPGSQGRAITQPCLLAAMAVLVPMAGTSTSVLLLCAGLALGGVWQSWRSGLSSSKAWLKDLPLSAAWAGQQLFAGWVKAVWNFLQKPHTSPALHLEPRRKLLGRLSLDIYLSRKTGVLGPVESNRHGPKGNISIHSMGRWEVSPPAKCVQYDTASTTLRLWPLWERHRWNWSTGPCKVTFCSCHCWNPTSAPHYSWNCTSGPQLQHAQADCFKSVSPNSDKVLKKQKILNPDSPVQYRVALWFRHVLGLLESTLAIALCPAQPGWLWSQLDTLMTHMPWWICCSINHLSFVPGLSMGSKTLQCNSSMKV